MKFTLTITDASIDELVAILTSPATPSTLRNSVSAAIVGAATDNDDETNDMPAAAGSVDSTGLPWDDRIHSTPAKLTSKGVWRAKRGVNDALVAQVEAELRARGNVQQQPVPQMTQPTANIPVPQPQMQPVTYPAVGAGVGAVIGGGGAGGYPNATQPVQTPAPQMQPVQIDPNFQPPQHVVMQQQPMQQVQQPAPGTIDFPTFMQHVATISQSGRADAAYFQDLTNRISQAFGVAMPGGITELQKDQRMIDYAIQLMCNEQRWV